MLNASRLLMVLLLVAASGLISGQSPPPPPPPPPVPLPAPGEPAPVNSQWRHEKAILSGVVTDGSGRNVGQAVLTFTGKFSGTRVQCRTNHSGQYRISLELGIYAVEVTAPRVVPLRSEVTLSEATVQNFTFGTQPAGASPPAPF